MVNYSCYFEKEKLHKMRIITVLLVLWLVFVSCADEKPENLLSSEKMEKVVKELLLAEKKLSSLNLPSDTLYQIYEYQKQVVLRDNAVTSAHFDKSLTYYLEHSEAYVEIYERIIDSLQLELKNAELKSEKKIKLDTLQGRGKIKINNKQNALPQKPRN